VSNAVIDLFPDIVETRSGPPPITRARAPAGEFDPNDPRDKFCRQFFEEYAQAHAFDPFQPEEWYAQSLSRISLKKDADRVKNYHDGSFVKALLHVFPSIGLKASKFLVRKRFVGDLELASTRRKYFEMCARELGYDPLVANTWYSKSVLKIISAKKETRKVLRHHSGGSLSQALLDLFPDIGLVEVKIRTRGKWENHRNRRNFFEALAKQHGFDPLLPKTWHSRLLRKSINLKPETRVILRYYGGSLSSAVMDIFPNVGVLKY